MSHRITTRTEIKDKKLALQALKAAGWAHRVEGNTIQVNDGPMRYASINLATGDVTGDTDLHRRGHDSLGALNQLYAEAKFKQVAQRQGHEIVSRSVDKQGRIRLRCKIHG
jgi:hypothetical protein